MNADERAALEATAREALTGGLRCRAAFDVAASPDVVMGLLADLAIARRRADWHPLYLRADAALVPWIR